MNQTHDPEGARLFHEAMRLMKETQAIIWTATDEEVQRADNAAIAAIKALGDHNEKYNEERRSHD